jgi:RHS repeat-associated protein
MTQRNADGKSYTFTYDADNRLVAVSGDSTALFMYDADGARVKSVMDGETTYFVGGHYEITNPGAGQTVTKYYIAGVTRVALRKNGTLSYMLADHLGSTSLVTDANGNRTSELRYMPWGAPRFSFGTMPTKYTFTGQFGYTDDPSTPGNEGFGLMYFGARWYDVSLGRFAQADTVIPKGVQGYDRYAYANNAPVKYVDPSGHSPVADTDAATTTPSCSETDNTGELVYRYCDLSNGARLDYSHFQAGVEDWQAVLKAWENDKKSVWVTNSFGGKDFSLKFSLEGIESVDDLRTAFISWYAKDYQIQFETFQGQNGGLKGKASSFNTEDIPSMVLGVTMASYFGKKADPKTLYTATIWLLGGGKGSNKDDHTGPRNSSWFLMTPTGTKLPYPSSSEGRFGLGILNDL